VLDEPEAASVARSSASATPPAGPQYVLETVTEPIDYDGAWKETLERYLHPFLELCFPLAAAGIDWAVAIEFLDQELQQVVRDADLGKQRADKLVKVQRLDGETEWVMIHIEVQAQRDTDLPRRLYQYHHRIADRFGRAVVSLVVLADAHPDWRPGPYEEQLWGCRLRFEYPVCKLLDLAGESGPLDKSDNPVAVVIAAHLAAQATAADLVARHEFKWALTRRLHERGYEWQDILELFRLLDWLLVLPDELEVAFRQKLTEYEEKQNMPHITSIERLSRQEGRQEGRQEDILDIVQARFGEVPYALREHILALRDEAELKRLLRQSALVNTLADFCALIAQPPPQ
jgi:hypothetical protein